MRLATTLLAAAAVTLGFGSAAYAADLIIQEEPVYVAPAMTGGNWDGAYIGAFAGAGWGTADHTNAVLPSPCAPDGCDLDLSGWLVGVTAGANFTVGGNFVLGVAGDIAWTDISGSDDVPFDYEHSVNWEGSLRAVAGFDGGAFMPYVTGGVAFANATHVGIDEADVTHIGATAGVGVMFAVADNVALDLQYRHSWYGSEEYDEGTPFNSEYALDTDRITLGVNFMF